MLSTPIYTYLITLYHLFCSFVVSFRHHLDVAFNFETRGQPPIKASSLRFWDYSKCSLIWVYTVCPYLSTRKLRIIMVINLHPINLKCDSLVSIMIHIMRLVVRVSRRANFSFWFFWSLHFNITFCHHGKYVKKYFMTINYLLLCMCTYTYKKYRNYFKTPERLLENPRPALHTILTPVKKRFAFI